MVLPCSLEGWHQEHEIVCWPCWRLMIWAFKHLDMQGQFRQRDTITQFCKMEDLLQKWLGYLIYCTSLCLRCNSAPLQGHGKELEDDWVRMHMRTQTHLHLFQNCRQQLEKLDVHEGQNAWCLLQRCCTKPSAICWLKLQGGLHQSQIALRALSAICNPCRTSL